MKTQEQVYEVVDKVVDTAFAPNFSAYFLMNALQRQVDALALNIEYPICLNCGESCDTIRKDIGIGDYECHGHAGNQEKLVEVARCCESDYLEEEE